MRKSSELTDAEIRAVGWQTLVERLGPDGALRFAIQTEHGYGDYSELRQRVFGRLSVDDLIERMERWKSRRAAGAAGARRLRRPRRRT